MEAEIDDLTPNSLPTVAKRLCVERLGVGSVGATSTLTCGGQRGMWVSDVGVWSGQGGWLHAGL